MIEVSGRVLVVDDTGINRTLLSTHLAESGHEAECAADGEEALRMLREEEFDVIFLDLVMPKMSGYEVLAELQKDARLRDIPVIIVSSIEDTDSIVRCVEMGATDYLFKPFNPVLVSARLNASLARKRMHDMQKQHLAEIKVEQEKTENILFNILPPAIAERLKKGEREIIEYYPSATVLFADIVGFTTFAAANAPSDVLFTLNTLFSAFDELVTSSGVEKVKTIGDEYMIVGGLPQEDPEHPLKVTLLALQMLARLKEVNAQLPEPMQLRIGIHTGPVVAGVIGSHKFAFDLWGDTVNTAHRVQTAGAPGKVLLSETTRAQLGDQVELIDRGPTALKGRASLRTFEVASTFTL